MKNYLLTIIGLAVLISCTSKTNEEKARKLIEPEIKSSLLKPGSYEFAKIKVDSCFTDSDFNPELIRFAQLVDASFDLYKRYSREAETSESMMLIYAPRYYDSAHDAHERKKYKSEMEKAQKKAAAQKEQIIQLYKNNRELLENYQNGKHEFLGWAVSFRYRAEDNEGIKLMDEVLVFTDKKFTEITDCFTSDSFYSLNNFEELFEEFGENFWE